MDLLVRPAAPEDRLRPAALRVREAVLHGLRGQREARAGAARGRLRRARPRRQLRVLPRRAGERRADRRGGRLPGRARRPALAPLRPADASRGCRCGAGRGPSGTCARPAASRPTRRPTPTTSTRWRSTPTGAAAASPSGCSTTPQAEAARAGLRALALDTGLHNAARPRALRGLRLRRARGPARAERQDGPRARRPGLRRLRQGGVEHGVERLGDLRHLALVISGKNGSAIERAATSSQIGNSPSRWPKRSR